MKLNSIKTIISVGISIALGIFCFEIAHVDNYRNWIVLGVTGISMFICLSSAIACDFQCKHRNANMKVCAWIFSILALIVNLAFCTFEYNINIYIVSISLLVLLNVGILYALYKPAKDIK